MRLTIPVLTAALLMSTAAIAANESNRSAIDALPTTGSVTVSGKVDKLVDKDTFILRDASGKTIDVHTSSNLTVEKGQNVTVKGEKSTEIAGMGEEIKASTITTGVVGNVAAAASKTTDKVGGTLDRLASGTPLSGDETPYANKNNKAELPNTSYDVDVNRDKNGDINVSADRQPDVKRNDANVAVNNNAHVESDRADVNVDTNVKATAGLGNIDTLPKAGNVELKGVVASVGGKDNFTLQDANGKTIKVETASETELKKGDTVAVNGTIGNRLLGMGRQIESSKVMVVGSK